MRFLLLFVLFSLLAGCGKTENKSETDQMVRISLQEDPATLNPHACSDIYSQGIVRALNEGLTRINPRQEIECAAASSVEISEDKTHYTFHLRDCKWSNGTKVTAFDFERSWKYALTPGSECIRAERLYMIKNGREAKLGLSSVEDIAVKAEDELTLHVDLEYPNPAFLEMVSVVAFFPIYFDSSGNVDLTVHNGPFKISFWRHNEEMLLEKNPLYWDVDHVRLDQISIVCVPDPNTSVFLFEKEALDWAGYPFASVPMEALIKWKNQGILQSKPVTAVYWMHFNNDWEIFRSPKIRRAFSMAINRDELTRHVLLGEEPAYSVLPCGLSLIEGKEILPWDMERARQLFMEGLKEIGLSQKELPPLVLSFNTSDGAQKSLAESIQQSWMKAFGINVALEGGDWGSFYARMKERQYQAGGFVWFSTYHDPLYFFDFFKDSESALNLPHWNHASFFSLVQELKKTSELKKREELIKEGELLLLEESPIAPVFNFSIHYALSDRVKNLAVLDSGGVDFKWAYIEQNPISRSQ